MRIRLMTAKSPIRLIPPINLPAEMYSLQTLTIKMHFKEMSTQPSPVQNYLPKLYKAVKPRRITPVSWVVRTCKPQSSLSVCILEKGNLAINCIIALDDCWHRSSLKPFSNITCNKIAGISVSLPWSQLTTVSQSSNKKKNSLLNLTVLLSYTEEAKFNDMQCN